MSLPTPEHRGTTFSPAGYTDVVPEILNGVTPEMEEWKPEHGIDPESSFPYPVGSDGDRFVHLDDTAAYEYGGDR